MIQPRASVNGAEKEKTIMAITEKNRLKKWIYQTNDPDLLMTYYERTEGLRNDTETDRLQRRITSALALDSMITRLEAGRDSMILDEQVFGVRRSGDRTELIGVLPDFEEGAYGDDGLASGWHQLFRSRGVEIPTEDMSEFAGEDYPMYVMRDLVERVLPKTQIETLRLKSYDNASDEEREEMERPEYDAEMAEQIRDKVREVVQKWRSPILVKMGNITLTVVGVDDDDLIFVEEGFAGVESRLSEIDPEAMLSDGSNSSGNVTMIYLTDKGVES